MTQNRQIYLRKESIFELRLTDESIAQQKSLKILLKAARFTQILVLALILSNTMLLGIMFGLIWKLLAK
jgi:hypothetical protein